uniref:Phosphatidylinositol-glycan biosynthesis class X protein n=1 Tax=Biomphalaria glabrata TaxID=6526 RepID=A0A2C9M139_BIOGL
MNCLQTFVLMLSVLWLSADAESSNIKNIKLKRTLLGHGFHRDLITRLTLPPGITASLSKPQCTLLLIETLPSGVYADPYQLNSLKLFGGSQVLFDSPVNVENAEFLSRSHELYIFVNVSDHFTKDSTNHTEIDVSFPIHARYHKPSPDKTHAIVTILHPSLYSNCSESDVTSSITAPCDLSNTSICDWVPLTYLSTSAPLTLYVPVGQESHKPIVILVTLLVSITVSALLVKVMWISQTAKHDKHS